MSCSFDPLNFTRNYEVVIRFAFESLAFTLVATLMASFKTFRLLFRGGKLFAMLE